MNKKIKITIAIILVISVLLSGLYYLLATETIFIRIPPLKGDFISDYIDIPYDKYIDTEKNLSSGEVYNIKDFGAKGNNKTLNTLAIQNAIDACHSNGGGTVLISDGNYVSGQIKLKSNVILMIANDAALIASKYNNHYGEAHSSNFQYLSRHFIYTDPADNAENIALIGPGKIYGNGEYFWNPPTSKKRKSPPQNWNLEQMINEHFKVKRYGREDRPSHVISFSNVKNLRVENIIFENMWGWTLYAKGCEDVEVRNVIINNNLFGENTDGMAFKNCRNVLVEKSFIATGDDGICYKADILDNGTNNFKLENYIFRDLEICSMTNGIKLGTTSGNDVGLMIVENIRLFNPVGWHGTIAGIAIESVDGSFVEGFSINNITMENQFCPIFIRLGNRNRYLIKDYIGGIENIHISNITATGVELPITISGVQEEGREPLFINGAFLENINITYRESNYNLQLQETIPENSRDYPEAWMFGDLPAYGIYARHTNNITIDNITVTPRGNETREKYFFDNVG